MVERGITTPKANEAWKDADILFPIEPDWVH
jgi:hypothetical protein